MNYVEYMVGISSAITLTLIVKHVKMNLVLVGEPSPSGSAGNAEVYPLFSVLVCFTR